MLSYFANIFWTGTGNCVRFDDQPPYLTAALDGTAQISCKHDDTNLVVMLWYQQQRTENMSLDLIGYSYSGSSPNYEPGFKHHYTQKRQDTVTGSLTISNLNLSDSAVYYCAASTQCCKINFY